MFDTDSIMDPLRTRNSLLGNRKSTSDNEKDNPTVNAPIGGSEIPPSYEDTTQAATEELNAALVSLHLSEYASALPTADECLAHLKLLSVFHALKEDVGYTDGIFGLWDARCDKVDEKDREKTLASMREKRWALYVARAVDRFQDWWTEVLCDNKSRLEWKSMLSEFPQFTEVRYPFKWKKEMLPPIGEFLLTAYFILTEQATQMS
jgi:hypothetical protein